MVPKVCSVDGCDKQEKPLRRGMCRHHYDAWHRKTPLSERMPPRPEERFWSKVDRGASDECWNWTAYVATAGYGSFSGVDGEPTYAHRFSLSLKLGRPLLPDAYACHTCDNRLCVNPGHLYEGTAQTNVADAVNRGRTSRGAKLPQAKLTEEDVLTIRHLAAAGEKNRDVAAQFGIKEPTMTAITHGHSWAHVGGPRSFKQKQKPKRQKAA